MSVEIVEGGCSDRQSVCRHTLEENGQPPTSARIATQLTVPTSVAASLTLATY